MQHRCFIRVCVVEWGLLYARCVVEQPTLNYEVGPTSFTVQVNVTGQLSKTITVTIAVTDVSRGVDAWTRACVHA
jgi:hypothetical protein